MNQKKKKNIFVMKVHFLFLRYKRLQQFTKTIITVILRNKTAGPTHAARKTARYPQLGPFDGVRD